MRFQRICILLKDLTKTRLLLIRSKSVFGIKALIQIKYNEKEIMNKKEKLGLIEQLKEHIPEFERKKEKACQKLENNEYASEKEKKELQDWVYEVFPYTDIVASMEEHLDSINLEEECCPACGGKVVSFYFRSPEWTWLSFVGRAADMKICVDCGLQFDFGFTGIVCMN